jgi:calcineurin-like phosphoesterase family protein
MIFYTSDHHFGHKNIIEYCSRPFRDVLGNPDTHYMNAVLIEKWNSVVSSTDTVYHLGDFTMCNNPQKYLSYLNGEIHLIRGNHDRNKCLTAVGFKSVAHDMLIEDDVLGTVYLSHAPNTDKTYRWNLCGHVHQKWKVNAQHINVGVDVWDFKPITMQEIRNFVAILSNNNSAVASAGELLNG